MTDNQHRIGFGSDNHSGAHPEILAALTRVNQGHQAAYGLDATSARTERIFEEHFGIGTQAFYVFNGTAANVLCLAAALRPYQSVICAESSHLNDSECGAPERMAGVKLLAVECKNGKLTPQAIESRLIRRGDQHHSQLAMISITQPTELGTVYSQAELQALGECARKNSLRLHMDGARLVNAAESLGLSLKEITRDVGVDVLSLGGTKNGLLFGEAVVFFDSRHSQEFKYLRKQLMQLPSKTRFLAAQFEVFLGTDLWLTNASHANRMAKKLSEALMARTFVEITQRTEANSVMVKLPRSLVPELRKSHFFYVWNEKTFECRLMTSWDTTESTIDEFILKLDELAAKDVVFASPERL